MTRSVPQRWCAPAAAPALILLLGGAALAEPVQITVLHTNDVYEIAPQQGRGGLAELATLLQRQRAAAAHTITTFGGDLISPSVLSGITEGAQMIELYNLLDTDVAVLGNHEFDFGPEIAAQRVRESSWLGTNVLGRDGKPAVGAVDLHDRGRRLQDRLLRAARPIPPCCPRPAPTSPSRRRSPPRPPRSSGSRRRAPT